MCFPMEAEPREVPCWLSCLPRSCHRRAGGAVSHAFHLPVIVCRAGFHWDLEEPGQKARCFVCQEASGRIPCWDFARTLGHHPLGQWQGRSLFTVGTRSLRYLEAGALESDPWAHVSVLPLSSCVSLSQSLNLSMPPSIQLFDDTIMGPA